MTRLIALLAAAVVAVALVGFWVAPRFLGGGDPFADCRRGAVAGGSAAIGGPFALTGGDGGDSGRLADVHVNVPDANPQRVQEVQQTILHLLCELIERPGEPGLMPGADARGMNDLA